MTFVRVPSWMVSGCVFVVLGLLAIPPVLAQGGPLISNLGARDALLEGDWLAYSQWESFRGEDLNGDGETWHSVVHVRRLSTGETTNLGLWGSPVLLSGDWLVFHVFSAAGLHVRRLSTGETTNLGLAGSRVLLSGDWLVFDVSERGEGEDLNGDGDTWDNVAHLVDLSGLALRGSQLPGDCNQDRTIDLSDAICIFGALFLGQPTAFPCGDGTPGHDGNVALIDWQLDGGVDLSDGIALLQFLFLGGPAHPLGRDCIPIAGCPATCPPEHADDNCVTGEGI